jgi:hypothetical protein
MLHFFSPLSGVGKQGLFKSRVPRDLASPPPKNKKEMELERHNERMRYLRFLWQVTVKIVVFWVETPCSVVDKYQRFTEDSNFQDEKSLETIEGFLDPIFNCYRRGIRMIF